MDNNHFTVGLLAHVDAGKTTFAEAMLYLAGTIKKMGSVDHKDTFLDHNAIEKKRGITVFSKQAELSWNMLSMTLLDTPGHVDFSSEMERTLQVLDYAILIISGSEGVQSHTKTLWELLDKYHIPTFIFVSKMDMPDTDRHVLMDALKSRLSDMCVDFSRPDTEIFYENCAMSKESHLEYYLMHGKLLDAQISDSVKHRLLFPCFFGSGRTLYGVSEFLDGLCRFVQVPDYPDTFGARIYKISRDAQNNRLTHMKITGGSLKTKSSLLCNGKYQKADQLRIYSGDRFSVIDEAYAGMICAVKGLDHVYPGMGLGMETSITKPLLEAVLDYRIVPPDGYDDISCYQMLRELSIEDPALCICWKEALREIHVRVMGTVQMEVLKQMIQDRFGFDISFDDGSIMYKETITRPAEGIGHYEIPRHYAEVHLLLEPLPAGSGLFCTSDCREDVLDKNWQHLILTYLKEQEYEGVLTGAGITDIQITLLAGKTHPKHTEGGDFKQAIHLALNQALSSGRSILLEPIYNFTLELPTAQIGRAMSDIEQMHGQIDMPKVAGDTAELTGTAPVACMRNYQAEVSAYTSGIGKCYLRSGGYAPCHNADDILAANGYDMEADTDTSESDTVSADQTGSDTSGKHASYSMSGSWEEDRELEAIFHRTFRSENRRRPSKAADTSALFGHESGTNQMRQNEPLCKKLPECLLVDGYNVIFAWPALADLAKQNLGAARDWLKDILCNYQGFTGYTIILVFDAYKVKGSPGFFEAYHNIYVVYTKEAETADMYIEKTTHENSRKYNITVATSDGLEQLIVMGNGARRISSRDLEEEIRRVVSSEMERYQSGLTHEKNLIPIDWEHLFKN